MKLALWFMLSSALWADGPGRLESKWMAGEAAVSANPSAAHWKGSKPVIADKDRYGKPIPSHRMRVWSVWTDKNIYFLFECPYDKLYLKPNPSTKTETNKLWDWDVAEVFIGAEFDKIGRYREFQVSPQGEWVDLDIDKSAPRIADGWKWNSGFEVAARIDESKKIWYGEMKIPIASIDKRGPKPGNEMRMNAYRIQGPMPDRVHINWNVVNAESYHTPEAFGRLVLVK
jgi:hypothetical protein